MQPGSYLDGEISNIIENIGKDWIINREDARDYNL